MKKTILTFLVGLFSATQIQLVGFLGISEVVMFLACPFILARYLGRLRQQGFNRVLLLNGLWLLAALISNQVNNVPWERGIRGLAWPYAMIANVVCLHALVEGNIRRVKWFIIGSAISGVWAMQHGMIGSAIGAAEALGVTAVEAAMEYKFARVMMFKAPVTILIVLWFLRIPLLCISAMVALIIVALEDGARSSLLVLSFSLMLLVGSWGNPTRIRKISKRAMRILALLLLGAWAALYVYKYAAESGLMGEHEKEKFARQSHARMGFLSGRGEFVNAFLAIVDSPLLGQGSWARDSKGFNLRAAILRGDEIIDPSFFSSSRPIQTHSHIGGAGAQHGIAGIIFWVYVLALLIRTIRHRMGLIPDLFGYLALTLPSMIWNILFSPPGGRPITACCIVVLIMYDYYVRQIQRRQVPEFVAMDSSLRCRERKPMQVILDEG